MYEFLEYFHVDGDESSINNFHEQKLIITDNEPALATQIKNLG